MAGAILALIMRRAELIGAIIGVALFFVSKPINLIAAPHHIILWLPFYAIVAAFPLAVAWELAARLPRLVRPVVAAALVGGLLVLWTSLEPRVGDVWRNQQLTERRLRNVAAATSWVKDDSERDATVLVAYFCFNADIVYSWFRALNVPVPATVRDGRTWVIWWGHARTFRGLSGYALATESDLASLKTRIDEVDPGQGTNPYADPRFTLVRSFGEVPTTGWTCSGSSIHRPRRTRERGPTSHGVSRTGDDHSEPLPQTWTPSPKRTSRRRPAVLFMGRSYRQVQPNAVNSRRRSPRSRRNASRC